MFEESETLKSLNSLKKHSASLVWDLILIQVNTAFEREKVGTKFGFDPKLQMSVKLITKESLVHLQK